MQTTPVRRVASSIAMLALTVALHAQSAGPRPLPMPPALEAPRDVAYRGAIQLDVDATDVAHRVFHVHETIPVAGGQPLVLLYPQWLPGTHAPEGRVDLVGGLVLHSNGTRLEWTRDPVDVFAFHVTPPAGATTLDAQFDFESPLTAAQGRTQVTPDMLSLQWIQLVLYPAGFYSRDIPVDARLTVPEGWTVATALDRQSAQANVITFTEVPLNTLVDSPAIAGRYVKTIELDPAGPPVRLNVVADRPELLNATLSAFLRDLRG